MSDLNIKNAMTILQVKSKLKSIHTGDADTKNSLLKLIEQFRCMDQIVKSTGLVKDNFSFVNRVSWDSVLSDLENGEHAADNTLINNVAETVSQTSSQLEKELIPQLQKMRNKWMYEVILVEFLFFGLITLAAVSVIHMQGLWDLSNISMSLETFLYERPMFSLLAGVFTFFSFLIVHFSVRKFVAKHLVTNANKESSEFDFAQAFLKNTRIYHSIFKPDIVGLSWLRKKCFHKNK